MAFWSSADVEIASRIVTAKTKNDRRVRGKLTLHFAKAQTQSDADQAADRCAAIAEGVLSEADSHEQLIGAESELVSAIRLRLPPAVPALRSMDLAALHLVGDPGTSAALRRASTSSLRAVAVPPGAAAALGLGSNRIATPAPPPPPSSDRAQTPASSPSGSFRVGNAPASSPPSGLASPPSSTSPSGTFRAPNSSPFGSGPQSSPWSPPPSRPTPPIKRGTIGRMRAITPGMMLPPGSPPDAIGQAIAPFVRDGAGRVLVGFLRAYDLVALRGLALEEGSAEMLAALVPVSDAPLGGYEASRTAELARWQHTFGDAVFQRIRRESQVVAVFLAHGALSRVAIPQNIALEILQEAAPAAFAGERGIVLEMGRYVSAPPDGMLSALCSNLVEIVGHGDPAQLSAALAPLVASVEEDMHVASTLARDAAGL